MAVGLESRGVAARGRNRGVHGGKRTWRWSGWGTGSMGKGQTDHRFVFKTKLGRDSRSPAGPLATDKAVGLLRTGTFQHVACRLRGHPLDGLGLRRRASLVGRGAERAAQFGLCGRRPPPVRRTNPARLISITGAGIAKARSGAWPSCRGVSCVGKPAGRAPTRSADRLFG